MNMKILSASSAVISWVLAVILVSQLLSGTFETRICQTTCMQIIYWTSFGFVVLGLFFTFLNYQQVLKTKTTIVATVTLLALFFIYLLTMAIGTFA